MWLLLKSKVLSNASWIALISLLLGMLTLKECQLVKAKRKASDMHSLYKAEVNKAEQFKKNGKNYTRVEAATIDAKNIKYLENKEIKALKEEVGNLKKNLISYSKVSTITQATFKSILRDTILLDSITPKPPGFDSSFYTIDNGRTILAKQFSYKDQYLKFDGIISGDSIIANYTIHSPFELYYYYKRPGKGIFKIFRKKVVVAELKFENPNTNSDNMYSLVLTRRKSLVRQIIGN